MIMRLTTYFPGASVGGGSGRRALSGGKATRGPERVPLLGGASLVHGESVGVVEVPNSMAETPRMGRSGAFTGAGRSLMEKEAATGLIDQAEETVEEVRCCGQEQNLYSILARLPAIHTVGVLSIWFFFGRTFLLLEHPDIAVLIVTFFMLYGIFRFWLMWGSAFHAMHSIRKCDSREKNYWQSKPRPPGPDFYSVWHAVMVPNYKEPVEKLRQTLDTLAAQTIAQQVKDLGVLRLGFAADTLAGRTIAQKASKPLELTALNPRWVIVWSAQDPKMAAIVHP